jgi:putative membrane protein
MRYGGYGMMGFGWGWLMMLGVLVLTILGVVALIRYLQNTSKNNTQPNYSNALTILNERYVKGEISEEEYIKMKSQILK